MSVARNYARALFESVKDAGGDASKFQTVESELAVAASWTEHPQAWSLLTAPVTSVEEKQKVVTALAAKVGMGETTKQFLTLLARKSRLNELPEIVRQLKSARLRDQGGILGHVDSAEALAEKDLEELSKAFGDKLGKKVEFTVSVEPELLAGLRVNVEGTSYDGTLRSRLNRLRDQVVHGASTIQ